MKMSAGATAHSHSCFFFSILSNEMAAAAGRTAAQVNLLNKLPATLYHSEMIFQTTHREAGLLCTHRQAEFPQGSIFG